MEVLKLSVDKWKGSPQQSIHILFNHEIPRDPTEKRREGGDVFKFSWKICTIEINVVKIQMLLSFVKPSNLINSGVNLFYKRTPFCHKIT